jgi:flagellar motility protein MotE (MotC chaperone)
MKNFIAWLLKAYAAVAAYAVAILAAVVLVLIGNGSLTGERIREAVQTLRGRPATVEPPSTAPKPADAVSEREQILEKRTQELQVLEERVATRLALIRAEQETLEKKRQDSIAAAAEAKKAQDDLARTRSDAELAANVPILSRMEAPGIISVLKTGDDARFVRTLRALRPTKAAEVLEALRTDPQFEEEFRRVPPDAPPGTKTRFERISDELKK